MGYRGSLGHVGLYATHLCHHVCKLVANNWLRDELLLEYDPLVRPFGTCAMGYRGPLAYTLMAYVVVAYIVMARGSSWLFGMGRGLYVYGLYSYGLYSYGL